MFTVSKGKKRRKIGTILGDDVVQMIKEKSFRYGLSISEVIEDAVRKDYHSDSFNNELKKRAAENFCSNPFKVQPGDVDDLINIDYYEE